MEAPKGEELIILKFENRDSRESVRFNSAICLQNAFGYFLSFNSNGEVKLDKNLSYEQYDSAFAKLTKWVILDAKDPRSTNEVTPFDDIMLR